MGSEGLDDDVTFGPPHQDGKASEAVGRGHDRTFGAHAGLRNETYPSLPSADPNEQRARQIRNAGTLFDARIEDARRAARDRAVQRSELVHLKRIDDTSLLATRVDSLVYVERALHGDLVPLDSRARNQRVVAAEIRRYDHGAFRTFDERTGKRRFRNRPSFKISKLDDDVGRANDDVALVISIHLPCAQADRRSRPRDHWRGETQIGSFLRSAGKPQRSKDRCDDDGREPDRPAPTFESRLCTLARDGQIRNVTLGTVEV